MPETSVRSLRFLVPGNPQFFYFKITDEEAKRLDRALQVSNTDEGTGFFVFSSPSGVEVAIALRDIQVVNLMWDSADKIPTQDTAPFQVDEDRINIHCRGRVDPYRAGADDPGDIASAFFMLDLYQSDSDPFLRFVDEDGELVFFRPDQIVLLTAPEWMVEEGREELDEENRRATAKPEKRKPPTAAKERRGKKGTAVGAGERASQS